MTAHNRNKTHDKLVERALKRPGVRKEYDALEEEYSLLKTMLQARLAAGKTQQEVAEEMGTTTSVVGRLETGGGKRQHSPTVATLRNYARALGYRLSIRFVKQKA